MFMMVLYIKMRLVYAADVQFENPCKIHLYFLLKLAMRIYQKPSKLHRDGEFIGL